MTRRRLDAELVRRGLTSSREDAQRAIADGRVLVAGSVARKAAHLTSPGEPIVVEGPPPRYVSRGGEKLDGALDRFAITVDGARALDAGVSTGGFTDCLLQRGVGEVVAVDVGYGQVHPRIRSHPRVTVHERTNVRSLTLGQVDGRPVDLVTADLSFISLRTVLPVLAGPIARPGCDLVLLVKPQFEAGRREASKGKGVITDPSVWRRAVEGVCSTLTEVGAAMMDGMVSPLTGADGNVEFFLHAQAHSASRGPVKAAELVAAMLEAAETRR